ncbi:MAG: hypothetical protein OES47_01530 [Acidobacteriota bacterium]|nr:hypothetical protein [Acidobacteriota bacterium]
MDPTDQLIVLTEVGVALAGFAGVVASFRFKAGARVSRGNVLGLSMMITIGLIVAFFSLLPLALLNFGLERQLVWGICSGLHGLNYTAFGMDTQRRLRKVQVRKRSSLWMLKVLIPIGGYGVAVALYLNAMGVVFHREFGVYFIALVVPLILSGYMFVRLVVHPLWKAVRERESLGKKEREDRGTGT